ncbi:helix-turn-helix domain-containing protein [Novosphingobium sp. KACC 22771]|uniref:helix-turn-helix domain-containing protein n=1 Tax=Novosphingobium sp. KACC 22771 TaxID=3025670 RepID=UPI003FD15717
MVIQSGAYRLARSHEFRAGHPTPGRASAERILTILSCFERGDEALGLAEVTRRTGLTSDP